MTRDQNLEAAYLIAVNQAARKLRATRSYIPGLWWLNGTEATSGQLLSIAGKDQPNDR